MNDPSQMANRAYGMWPQKHRPPMWPSLAAVAEEPVGFQSSRPPVFTSAGSKAGRISWKSKKAAEKRKRAKSVAGAPAIPGVIAAGGGAGVSGYKPPSLNELQYQNRVKARRFYPKKKFNRFPPFAPRNTTSFIIRAKKSGGIASLISPSPVTPAILPTPTFSPSRERLVDMAKEEWGVDGYGSMKGLIRLRSPVSRGGGGGIEDEDVDDDSSESDVEEHVEVERRLDHDLSRFEIVYPSIEEEQGGAAATAAAFLLGNRVEDQDAHITRLEEENLTLKERLFLVEREMGELRMRLQLLETDSRLPDGTANQIKSNNGDDDGEDDDDDHDDAGHGEGVILNSMEANPDLDAGGEVCSEKRLDYEENDGGNLLQG